MAGLIPIAACKQGEKLNIVAIKTFDDTMLRKLAVFGILPGAEVQVLQTKPAFVLQVEYTQLAVDDTIAGIIYGYR